MACLSRCQGSLDYAAHLKERALELRNLALTTSDAEVCRELHYLADLLAAKAASLARRPSAVIRLHAGN